MPRTSTHRAECFVLFLLLPIIASCATVYTAPDFGEYKADHKQIAILPFDVTINPEKRKGMSHKKLEQLTIRQAESFQRALYTQYLQGQQRGKYTVEFQDISETNTLLTKNSKTGDLQKYLSSLTKAEICAALDVDAIVSGEIVLTKPMGSVEAIASMYLFNVPGRTNEVYVNTSIHERDEGKLLWNYDYVHSGSILSSSESVAKRLIYSAAASFPYTK